MKKVILFLGIMLCFIPIFAQETTITGTVIETGSNSPLTGVNVVIKENPAVGVTTDLNGKYSLTVTPEFKTLVFSFVGFDEIEEPLDGRTTIDVSMKEQSYGLNQVVISASKRQEKLINAPASVSIVTAERLKTQTSLASSWSFCNKSKIIKIKSI